MTRPRSHIVFSVPPGKVLVRVLGDTDFDTLHLPVYYDRLPNKGFRGVAPIMMLIVVCGFLHEVDVCVYTYRRVYSVYLISDFSPPYVAKILNVLANVADSFTVLWCVRNRYINIIILKDDVTFPCNTEKCATICPVVDVMLE